MRLILIRHAESTANAEGRTQGHADFELSANGRAQAKRLSQKFQAEGFVPTTVYSSPLLRAAQTAEILTRSWPVGVIHSDDLKEYDLGGISGLTREEIAAKYPNVDIALESSRQFVGIEGAEPLAERRARGQRAIDVVLNQRFNRDVIVAITHGGILQQIVAALMKTKRTWGVQADNTAVFGFTIDTSRWNRDDDNLGDTSICRIDAFNDTAHLFSL